MTEYEEKEREEQRKYAEKTVAKMHHDYWTSGNKGRQKAKDFEGRILKCIDSDAGSLWYAGEVLKEQIKKEQADKGCAFRFKPETYMAFLDRLEKDPENIKEQDEDLYADDSETADIIAEFLYGPGNVEPLI